MKFYKCQNDQNQGDEGATQNYGYIKRIRLRSHHGQTDLLLPMNPAFAAPPPAALPVFPPVVAAAAPLPPPAFLPAAAPLVGPAPLLPYSVGAVLAPAPGPPPVAWNAFQTHWNNFHFMYNNPVLRRFLIGKK
uniref:Uncharacterized protein n=1 Tax=Romanomermis culicivorax TaxID=13658 RepID=A0A915KLG9_ROMCU